LPEELFDFRSALEQNPSYIELGNYATHLTMWLEYFDLEQIHIVDYEEIRSQPAEVLRGMFRFVGVDPEFVPAKIGERINVSRTLRSKSLHNTLRMSSKGLRKLFGGSLVHALKSTGLPALVRKYNQAELDSRRMPPLEADRHFLADTFAEESARFGEMIGRDLSHWK
jgi:hypothetical protein